MALRKKKSEAIRLRREGASYSQIQKRIGVSKSTLSLWLRDMPLSEKRLRSLRDFSAVRIEHFRESMRRKREVRHEAVYQRVSAEVANLSRRDIFIAGLFLYWGEGGKTADATTVLSNNDPAMIRFFILWLESLGASRERMRVYLHLYSDMDLKKELAYWSRELSLPPSAFRKPHVKKSKRSELTYVQKFSHGTCNLIYPDQQMCEYVLAGLEHLRSLFAMRDRV